MGKKIAFIGCGKIAPFHADVLIKLGHEIISVAARENSENIDAFKAKYKVKSIYSNWRLMMENEQVDAVWLLASWDQNNAILQGLIPYKVPIFAEKPLGVTEKEIDELITLQKEHGTKIQVGHNRRYYDFIPELKEKLKGRTLRSVSVEIPETTGHLNEYQKKFLWIHNSSHVVDLLYCLLGKMDLKSMVKSTFNDTVPNTFSAFLETKDKVPVQINATWNSPTNFGIKLFLDNRIYELRPIEFLNVYEGFDILEPNEEVPVRRYNPRKIYSRYASSRNNVFKPGFLNQAKHFFNNEESDFEEPSLEDMKFITRLTEQLM